VNTKALSISFIALSFAIILIPLAFTDKTPKKVSEMENRYLAEFPTLDDHPNANIGGKLINFAWDYETYLKDRVGFRDNAVRTWSIIQLATMDKSGQNYTLGKEGWIFYHGFSNARYLDGGKEKIVDAQVKLQEHYAENGVDYFLLIPPAKSEVYPEFLPSNITADKIPDTVDLTNALISAGVNAISPLEKILEDKSLGKVYAMSNHHWSGLGSYAGYLSVIEALNNNGYDIQAVEVEFVEEKAPEANGTNDLGIPGVPVNGVFIDDIVPRGKWERSGTLVESGEEYDALHKVFEKFDSGYGGIIVNSDAAYGTLVLYGDSFMADRYEIPYYFAEHFKKVVWVINLDSVRNQPEIDEYFKPDVVLDERYGNGIYRIETMGELVVK